MQLLVARRGGLAAVNLLANSGVALLAAWLLHLHHSRYRRLELAATKISKLVRQRSARKQLHELQRLHSDKQLVSRLSGALSPGTAEEVAIEQAVTAVLHPEDHECATDDTAKQACPCHVRAASPDAFAHRVHHLVDAVKEEVKLENARLHLMEEAEAVRIQAAYRGYAVRQNLQAQQGAGLEVEADLELAIGVVDGEAVGSPLPPDLETPRHAAVLPPTPPQAKQE